MVNYVWDMNRGTSGRWMQSVPGGTDIMMPEGWSPPIVQTEQLPVATGYIEAGRLGASTEAELQARTEEIQTLTQTEANKPSSAYTPPSVQGIFTPEELVAKEKTGEVFTYPSTDKPLVAPGSVTAENLPIKIEEGKIISTFPLDVLGKSFNVNIVGTKEELEKIYNSQGFTTDKQLYPLGIVGYTNKLGDIWITKEYAENTQLLRHEVLHNIYPNISEEGIRTMLGEQIYPTIPTPTQPTLTETFIPTTTTTGETTKQEAVTTAPIVTQESFKVLGVTELGAVKIESEQTKQVQFIPPKQFETMFGVKAPTVESVYESKVASDVSQAVSLGVKLAEEGGQFIAKLPEEEFRGLVPEGVQLSSGIEISKVATTPAEKLAARTYESSMAVEKLREWTGLAVNEGDRPAVVAAKDVATSLAFGIPQIADIGSAIGEYAATAPEEAKATAREADIKTAKEVMNLPTFVKENPEYALTAGALFAAAAIAPEVAGKIGGKIAGVRAAKGAKVIDVSASSGDVFVSGKQSIGQVEKLMMVGTKEELVAGKGMGIKANIETVSKVIESTEGMTKVKVSGGGVVESARGGVKEFAVEGSQLSVPAEAGDTLANRIEFFKGRAGKESFLIQPEESGLGITKTFEGTDTAAKYFTSERPSELPSNLPAGTPSEFEKLSPTRATDVRVGGVELSGKVEGADIARFNVLEFEKGTKGFEFEMGGDQLLKTKTTTPSQAATATKGGMDVASKIIEDFAKSEYGKLKGGEAAKTISQVVPRISGLPPTSMQEKESTAPLSLSTLKTEAPSQQVIPPSQKVFTLPATLPTQETFRPEPVSTESILTSQIPQTFAPQAETQFTSPFTLPTILEEPSPTNLGTFDVEKISPIFITQPTQTIPSAETMPTITQPSFLESTSEKTTSPEVSFEPQIISPQISEPSETFSIMQIQPTPTYEQPSIIQPFTLPAETEKISQQLIPSFTTQEQPFAQPTFETPFKESAREKAGMPEINLIGMGETSQIETFQEQFSTQTFEPLLIQQTSEKEYIQPSFQMTGTNILSTQEEKQNQVPILSMQNLLDQQGAETQAIIPRMETVQKQTMRQEQILRQTQRLTTTTTSPTTAIPPIGIPPPPIIFGRRGESLGGFKTYGGKGRAKGGKGKQKIMPFADLASITFSVAKYGKATLPRMTAQSVGKFREKYGRIGIAGVYKTAEQEKNKPMIIPKRNVKSTKIKSNKVRIGI